LLVDRAGRIKPCGGAIPPRAIRDFDIPDSLLVAHARCARMISPSDQRVDIPIENGFVGLVDRDEFDEWLRQRAAQHGATRLIGTFDRLDGPDADGITTVSIQSRASAGERSETEVQVRTRLVIGADGAKSRVAAQAIEGFDKGKFVFAYHEIVRAPAADERASVDYDPSR